MIKIILSIVSLLLSSVSLVLAIKLFRIFKNQEREINERKKKLGL